MATAVRSRRPGCVRRAGGGRHGAGVRTVALFGFGGGAKTKTREVPDFEVAREESMSEAYARVRAQRAASKKKFERQQAREEAKGINKLLVNITQALDFQEDIEEDRGLLSAARRLGKGESMSREQYGALRRKVGGTKGGFFGESVDVVGKYTDRGYVERQGVEEITTTSEEIPGLPFLVLTLVGVLGATGYVVAQTSSAGAI